jgi:hypothetical protein
MRQRPTPARQASDSVRVQQLHLIAAARAAAVRPTSQQQVSDIVRVTADDEVDTRTFRAIVADISADVLR